MSARPLSWHSLPLSIVCYCLRSFLYLLGNVSQTPSCRSPGAPLSSPSNAAQVLAAWRP